MKILLLPLRGNIIGDSVREISLVKRILRNYKNSTIIYPCPKIIYDLFQNNIYLTPIYIKELDELNKINIGKIKKLYFLFKASVNIVSKIKNIDRVIYTGSKVKVRQFISKFISYINKGKYSEINFEKGVGIYTELFFTNKEKVEINSYLPSNNKKNICICIESTDIKRTWGVVNFKKLIDNLYKTNNILLVGIDKNYNKYITNIFGKKIIDLVGKLNIRQTALIIKNSNIYIGNDSGLVHVASGVGTNILVITLNNTIDENMIFNNKKNNYCKIFNKPKINNLLNEIINEKYIGEI